MIAREADKIIAGVDEVGRGPLAGSVVAAAVILPAQYDLPGLNDSKKISEKKREILFDAINMQAIAVGVGECTPAEIDDLNILQASFLAMERAVAALCVQPTHLQVDGNQCPRFAGHSEAFVGGDAYMPCIMAGSIIAKVTRDRQMVEYDNKYPGYGLAKHKGYPTKAHMAALAELGVTPIHRRSYAPVRRALQS